MDDWEKAKRIFADAVKVTPELRLEFLDEVCEGDKIVRREVESLLASFDDAESFMESPAVGEVADMIESKVRKLGKGVCFGHYEIIEQIGIGGMGEVYLAKDKKLDRKVAVKILNEKFAKHESNLNRFIQEAKAASALNHPNILVIHEIGETEDVHYIVSEFVKGKTLREIFKEKTLRLSEVLDIAVQIANALVAAHEAHLVHRDIKPENIIIRPDGYAKILDFGLAKLIEQKNKSSLGFEESTIKQNQTAKGVILGTVSYMSPEQAKGKRINGRTDIFSLGVVVYEMIAGRTPFAGDSVSETIANLLNAGPPPLSRFTVNLPDELQRIISKMLRKNADERYQTMRDVLTDLKNLQKRLEFETEFNRFGVPPGTSPDLKHGEQETQILEVIPTVEKKPTENKTLNARNSIAVLPFTNMSNDAENEYFCDGLAEELLNALAKIKDLKVAARTSAFSFKNRSVDVSEIGKTLNVKRILEGSVRKVGNRLRISVQLINAADGYQIWSERYDGELKDIFDLQDEITLAVIDELKVKFLVEEKAAVLKRYTDNPKAYEFYLKGIYYRWKLEPEEFGKCLKYFEQAVETDPNFALAYFGVASYYGYGAAWGLVPIPPSEGWAKAEAAIAKAMEVDSTLPENQLTLAAFKLVNHRDWAGAGAGIERAAELNPKFPEIHHLYGFYLLAIGRFDDAISEAELALELDPLSLNYSRFLGICFFFARRYEEAIGQFKQALELEPNNPSVHEILGGVFVQKGMFAEAVAAWQRAMTLEGDDELAAILNRAKDNFPEAVQAVAQKRIERMNAKTASGEFVLAINFARAHLMLGDEEQIFHWLKKAVEERNVFPLLMNSDPFYDRVRADSRFQDLMRRISFPTDENAPGRTTDEAGEAITAMLSNSTTEEDAAEPLRNSHRIENRKQSLVIGLITILLAVGGFGYYFWSANKSVLNAGDKKSLAVLPFVNASQDPNAEYLSDGITESIINNLSQLSGLRVMSRNSAFRFKNNLTDTKNIASQLGVESLVTGDIKQLGDRLVINVRLIDASDDSQIWGNQYVKTTADVIAAQTEIAQAVANNLRLKLTSAERQQLGKNYTENSEAYQLYLRGRYHYFKLTEPEIRKSINYYQQAIVVDPTYALAYAGIADAYRTFPLSGWKVASKEAFPQAKVAAKKALEIDATLAEAYIALGWVGFLYDWDWSGAESELKKAIELAPNSSDAHRAFAHLLSNSGRHEEAVVEGRRARELDPLSLITNVLEGQFLFYAGHDEEAIDRLRKTLEIEPNFWIAHNVLARVYIRQGRFEEAVAELNKAIELSGGGSTEPFTQLGYALAKSGKREQAQAILEKLKSLAAENFVPAYSFAMIYNGLGEKEEALNYLEKSFQEREVQISFIKVDTRWDELRAEPRFANIIKQMNF